MEKRIFISADHGLAVIYFLQSDLVPVLLDAGVEIVILTDDGILERIKNQFKQPGLLFEGLRLNEAKKYFRKVDNSKQWWLDFLRRAGASNRINLQAVDGYINQVEDEAHSRRKILFPLMRGVVWLLRNSRTSRKVLKDYQNRYADNLYADLFQRYKPDLVLASTPGWRWDRYLLREAARAGFPTGAVIVGWDNTSSYSLPGAPVEWITCWSQIQKEELINGADWSPENVHIGGIPSYDGYFRREWLIPKEDYCRLHNLDPDKKIISYACSFVSFSPNIQNIEALARIVTSQKLSKPSQLLIRFHPNHFLDVPRFIDEREKIRRMAGNESDVHVVEPVPLGGSLGYYSGEDMPEKSSMMAHSDIFTTVYSTMVVEASTHGTPVVSICIDSPEGWPGKYTLPLSKIAGWPTHARFRNSGAGREVLSENQLEETINFYLKNPGIDQDARSAFIEDECTFTDGSAGKRTAKIILSRLNNRHVA
jgi:hypothetical protein